MASVKRLLIFLVVVGGIWFIHKSNPTLDDHMDAISPVELNQRVNWDDLVYTDLYLVSFTKSYEKHTLVSFGLVRYVNVVDDDWAEKNLLQEEDPFR